MTWKIKIINITTKENDFVNIHVYFSIFKQDPVTTEFKEFFKDQKTVPISSLKGKTKNQQESFIKDFVKTTVQPLIDTFAINVNLDDLIGFEEVL